MDSVIKFFTETLNGPFYIITSLIGVTLISLCAIYLIKSSKENNKDSNDISEIINNTDSYHQVMKVL